MAVKPETLGEQYDPHYDPDEMRMFAFDPDDEEDRRRWRATEPESVTQAIEYRLQRLNEKRTASGQQGSDTVE